MSPTVLRSITEEFVGNVECPICQGWGHVCENHPEKAWDVKGGCSCGAGMPCRCTTYAQERDHGQA